ncbi:MAG: hypothetical protein KF680_07180 [Cryobacterium sp.]|nr:hypothetical protein [Cryobacterium sp.]
MTPPPDETRPSLSNVYQAINEVKTDVAVIKNELGDLVDHERRIRTLEQRMWAAIGIFGLLAALSPYLSRLIP